MRSYYHPLSRELKLKASFTPLRTSPEGTPAALGPAACSPIIQDKERNWAQHACFLMEPFPTQPVKRARPSLLCRLGACAGVGSRGQVWAPSPQGLLVLRGVPALFAGPRPLPAPLRPERHPRNPQGLGTRGPIQGVGDGPRGAPPWSPGGLVDRGAGLPHRHMLFRTAIPGLVPGPVPETEAGTSANNAAAPSGPLLAVPGQPC